MEKIDFKNYPDTNTPITAERLNQMQTNIDDAKLEKTAVSDIYSTSSTYAVGDYCIYGNTLYKCTTAISTAEAWNSGHWTAVSVADEINARVKKSGDTMTGNLKMESNSVEWKETNYGDKFRIIPDFNGAGSSNRLLVQSTVGDAGTDPTNWKTLVSIHAETGEVDFNANDTGWQAIPLTSPATTPDWSVLMYRKINNIVYIRGGVYWNQTPNWGTQFGVLPEGFRPIAELDCVCRSINASTGSATVIAIHADGTMIYLNNTDWTPGEGCLINYCFIAEN